jgi:hypothetical protein
MSREYGSDVTVLKQRVTVLKHPPEHHFTPTLHRAAYLKYRHRFILGETQLYNFALAGRQSGRFQNVSGAG